MSLALKFAALAALIVPFAPRREVVRETVPALTLEPIVIDAEDVEIVPEPAPTVSNVPELCDQDAAVREYLRELMDQFPGDEISCAEIYKGYCQLRERSGWPKITDNLLSRRLRKYGVERFQKDLRAHGLGKPIFFRIPCDEDEALEIAELRDAA